MIATFSIMTTLATFALLLIGGVVNPTGSSLACPDWPTCYGSFFPEMTGGILYEHTHRGVASLVGLMTCMLAVLIWRHPKHSPLRWLALTAVGLVIFQGLLGGITVLLKLPLFVSTAHLATSLIFFLLLIYTTFRLINDQKVAATFWSKPKQDSCNKAGLGCTVANPFRCVKHSLIAVYLQMILGALVRHTGSGPACGTDILSCSGTWFPQWGAGQLHLLHRGVGIFIVVVVITSAWQILKAPHIASLTKVLGGCAVALVLSQVALGLVTVGTSIALVPVTAHLGTGTLLLATLFILHLRLQKNRVIPGA